MRMRMESAGRPAANVWRVVCGPSRDFIKLRLRVHLCVRIYVRSVRRRDAEANLDLAAAPEAARERGNSVCDTHTR